MVDETKKRCRTYRYRLNPTVRQTQDLARQLVYQRELYNAALEERIGVWKWEKRPVTFFDQCKTLTGLREVRPEVVACGITLCRGTLKRLDRAFVSFCRRVGRDEIPGFPRFKSAGRFESLHWVDIYGWKLKGDERRLFLRGIGDVKFNYCRPISGIAKTITIKREGRKWWLNVHCIDVPAMPLPPTGREVGIDLGVSNIVATSDGELIVAERFNKRARVQLADAQRKLAGQQRGSNRHRRQRERIAQLHRRVVNQRNNSVHQLSRSIVNNYDLIILEDLKITNMTRTPEAKPDPARPGAFLRNGSAAKAGLNHSIYDAGWGKLASLLSYKAESAGRVVVSVDPRYTSQTCAECGHAEAGNRVEQAVFRCQACKHEAHADVNAARNILRAGRARQALACVG